MQNISECEKKIAHNALERKQLHDVTTLAGEIKNLLVRHNDALKNEGIRKDLRKLEEWLETERHGPAPAGIISESGVMWLIMLRDKLKLSAEEAYRLEGEGGTPSDDQNEKTEELMNAVRRIDEIIGENPKTH